MTQSNQLLSEKKKKLNLKVASYVLFSDITEDCSSGGNFRYLWETVPKT